MAKDSEMTKILKMTKKFKLAKITKIPQMTKIFLLICTAETVCPCRPAWGKKTIEPIQVATQLDHFPEEACSVSGSLESSRKRLNFST